MSFIKKIIENRLVQFPHRYKLTKVDGIQDTYDLEPITGNITSVGTPVDKALLQRYEDVLYEHETAIGNKLDKTGDSKSNTVTFIEATADADIVTGESHTTLFGKIKKRFSTIATTLTNINSALNGKAPTNHASTAATYGIGTTANYGHVKLYGGLDRSNYVDGEALSSNVGKTLGDKLDDLSANKVPTRNLKASGKTMLNGTAVVKAATLNITSAMNVGVLYALSATKYKTSNTATKQGIANYFYPLDINRIPYPTGNVNSGSDNIVVDSTNNVCLVNKVGFKLVENTIEVYIAPFTEESSPVEYTYEINIYY